MKQIAAFLCTAALALPSIATAQTVRTDLFDVKKSQQELEVMRGILSTTLGFVVREVRSRGETKPRADEWFRGISLESGNVSAYYLYGQGAIFSIPSSTLHSLWAEDSHFRFAGLGEMEAAYARLAPEAPLAGGVPGGVPGGVVGGVGGSERRRQAPQAAQANPDPNPQSTRRLDETRTRLQELQERVKERRAETEKRRAKMQEHLVEVRGYLIEALANHGDSLTHVKPAEYVTLILATDDGEPHFPGEGTRTKREIISVPKSVITDYKAGRLNLEGFKQKVLTYSN